MTILPVWIVLVLLFYNYYIRIDENKVEYVVHDVPPLYENQWGMTFVYIKPGKFLMGDRPAGQRKIYLTHGFYIQKTEVTQGQWQAIMGKNPSKFESCGLNCPVEMVSRKEVEAFIEKLKHKHPGKNYRLPTEAEWEYTLITGDNFTSDTVEMFQRELKKFGWYSANSLKTPHPVATLKPNRYGVHDMHGNIYEWCMDRFNHYPSNDQINPLNRRSGRSGDFVVRGGSWKTYYYFCQHRIRSQRSPHMKYHDVGLRLVLEVNQKSKIP